MRLTEFLLARIAEDEDAFREQFDNGTPDPEVGTWLHGGLAECEAKRRIVEESHVRAIIHLVVVYADHPDYQQEWRP